MDYSEPAPRTKEEAECLLASDNRDAICETIVALALNEPDLIWVQDRCVDLTHHQDWQVRAIAATCLGHLARIHGTLNFATAKPRLLELLKDARTRGYAESAAGDIKMFTGFEILESQ